MVNSLCYYLAAFHLRNINDNLNFHLTIIL